MHISHNNEADNAQTTDEYSLMLLSHYFIFRYMYKPSAIPNIHSRDVMWDSLSVERDLNHNRFEWGGMPSVPGILFLIYS